MRESPHSIWELENQSGGSLKNLFRLLTIPVKAKGTQPKGRKNCAQPRTPSLSG
jgi:hypothetical protein